MTTGIDRRIARDIFGWTEVGSHGPEIVAHMHPPGPPSRHDLPPDVSCDGTDLCRHLLPSYSRSELACVALKTALRRAGIDFAVFHWSNPGRPDHRVVVLRDINEMSGPAAAAATEPEAVARFAVALLDADIIKPKVQP